MASRRLPLDQYTIGWICALPIELAAARQLLDEPHQEPQYDGNDPNKYFLGQCGGRNVAIVCLPAGRIGTNRAATVVTHIKKRFPSIQTGLMVGIGGGVPSSSADIRLGDVIISQPIGVYGGVVQYDSGKTGPGGKAELTGHLNAPPDIFLNALSTLKANMFNGHGEARLKQHLTAFEKLSEFGQPSHDKLYEPTYEHSGGPSCDQCSDDRLVPREPRARDNLRIHYGTIASGNQVIKDAVTRDRISQKLGGILCFEMEAAGIMNELPCLVIRGVCDYADSHKNKDWQPRAAAAAAACAKEILDLLPSATGSGDFKQNEWNTIAMLPHVPEAKFSHRNNQHDAKCLPNTRVGVLEQIRVWANDSSHDKIFFWLNGMAGTGKSTIARTLAMEFSDARLLAASFFFSRGGGDRASSSKLFTSLAMQIAETARSYRSELCRVINHKSDIGNLGLQEQWKEFIIEPLQEMAASWTSTPLVIIIDALDECDDIDDIPLIINLLASLPTLLSTNLLKILITSRPETSIRFQMDEVPAERLERFILHAMDWSIVRGDLLVYFEHELAKLRKKFELHAQWPGKSTIEALVNQSNGLFIYAATTIRFLGENSALLESRLDQILGNLDSSLLPAKKVDQIYTLVLTQALPSDFNEEEMKTLHNQFSCAVGGLGLLFDALPLAQSASLLGISETELKQALSPLQSIIDVPVLSRAKIRFLHPSFRDFLLDKGRCSHPVFQVNRRLIHYEIFCRCMNLLSSCLRPDMCNVGSPMIKVSDVEKNTIQDNIPLHVQYAARFWFRHLEASRAGLSNHQPHDYSIETPEMKQTIEDYIINLLRKDFLGWLETLAWVGQLREAILSLADLELAVTQQTKGVQMSRGSSSLLHKPLSWTKYLQGGTRNQSKFRTKQAYRTLANLVHDAYRFTRAYAGNIEAMPLQAYTSALMFCPEQSVIKSLYRSQISPWVKVGDGHSSLHGWSAVLQTLTLTAPCRQVDFSKERHLLAALDRVGAVSIFDTRTGSLRQKLESKCHTTDAIQFSNDGRMLATYARFSVRVLLWNVLSGSIHKELRWDHLHEGILALSPNLRYTVSPIADRRIEVWDTETGQTYYKTPDLPSFNYSTPSAAFSPDGQSVALRLGKSFYVLNMNLQALKLLKKADDSSGAYRRVLGTFSMDGKLLAYATKKFIRVVDVASMKIRHSKSRESLKSMGCEVKGLALSPDGSKVAFETTHHSIYIWDFRDQQTHFLSQPDDGSNRNSWFKGREFSFSPDGQILAFIDGFHIRLLDTNIRTQQNEFQMKDSRPLWISSDGHRIIKHDNWSRIISPSGDHFCSQDGGVVTLCRSGSNSGSIVSEYDTGREHANCSFPVFSSDGEYLAVINPASIALWNVKTATTKHIFSKTAGVVQSGALRSAVVGFSVEGRSLGYLAASDYNTRFIVWDTETGSIRRHAGSNELNWPYPNSPWRLAVSSDTEIIAVADRFGGIILWNVKLRVTVAAFTIGSISEISFTASHQYLRTSREYLDLRGIMRKKIGNYTDPKAIILVSECWIKIQGQRVLQIPSDYNDAAVYVSGNFVAFRLGDGPVKVLRCAV